MAAGDDVRRERVTCPKSDGGCGGRFWRNKGSRRRRCEECSPPSVKSRSEPLSGVVTLSTERGAAEVPAEAVQAPEGPSEAVLGPVEAATLATLRGRKREDTPEGRLALLLAHQMEARVHSGSQLAAMSKELREALARAVSGAPEMPDAVDEITARRQRRVRGA